jgi:hypothetical protein
MQRRTTDITTMAVGDQMGPGFCIRTDEGGVGAVLIFPDETSGLRARELIDEALALAKGVLLFQRRD